MATVMKDIVTWLKQWFYTEDEIDTTVQGLQSQINNKADSTTVSGLTTTVGTKADKTGGVQQITDANAHTNLGTSANATQSAINTAIDTMIGNLISTELIVVVSSLPNANSSTMNKIYCLTGGSESSNKFTEYLTVKEGSAYSWEKIGEISSGSLTVNWADILNKPSNFTPSVHSHEDGEVEVTDTALINMGYSSQDSANHYFMETLKLLDIDKVDKVTGKGLSTNDFTDTLLTKLNGIETGATKTTIDSALLSSSANPVQNKIVNTALNLKANKSETIDIDDIILVNKGETNEGCIIFNTIT